MVLQQIRAQSQHHAIPHMQDQQSMNDEAHLAISEIVTSLSSEQTLCDQNEDPDVKEGSILTMYTADTMTVDAKENWRQLRKALQGMGVSDQVFKQRQGYITSKLRELIVEVEPEQEGDADFSRPQLDHVPEQTKLTEDSDVFTSGSSIRTFYTCTEEAEQFAPDLPPKPMTRSIESQPTLSDKILKSLGYYRQDNALLAAIKAGDIVQLETCLRRGANINGGKKPSKRLGVPLVLATYLGNQGIVRLLLDRGADIEAVDDYSGNSSLMWAASKGQVGMVQLLLNRSANIEAKTRFGGTAIMGAAYWNNKDVVQLLLERGADIEAKNKEDRTSLLEASTSAFSSKEMVLLLLERGAKIDAKDKYDCTSLMVAAWKGHMGIVLLLRDWGADIEPKNIFGQAAHMMAAWNGHKYVVQVLLGWGADIEVKDKYGRTALLMATGEGHKSAVQLLLEWGADIEAKDESSWTALTMAASQGHKSVVQLLLDRGANFSTKDNKGRTPRDYVIEESLKLNGMIT